MKNFNRPVVAQTKKTTRRKYLFLSFLLTLVLGVAAINATAPSTVYAAACPGSDAPDGTDCATIPGWCPGASKSGLLPPGDVDPCPFNSTQSGPGVGCVGSNAPVAVVCSDIPAGCPGSTKSAVRTDNGAGCPYKKVDPKAASGNQKVTIKTGNTVGKYQCGSGEKKVMMSVNIGCRGEACQNAAQGGCNALTDAIFAIIRFITIGIGLLIVGSFAWAAIQVSAAQSDPAKVALGRERAQNTLLALLVYIFAAAILNFVIPKGFFNI